MLKHAEEPSPRDGFRERFVSEVEKLAGETKAGCVDVLLGAMPDYFVDPTARNIRRILGDAHFVEMVDKMNLVNVVIEDPNTSERILRVSLKPDHLSRWADSQPLDEKRRFAQGKAEKIHRDTEFREITEALLRSIPSEQMEGPSSLAKAEKGAHRSRPDDDSGGTQTNAQSPGESWVRPYEQERHGDEVPTRGYWRHHAASDSTADSSALSGGLPHQVTQGAFIRMNPELREYLRNDPYGIGVVPMPVPMSMVTRSVTEVVTSGKSLGQAIRARDDQRGLIGHPSEFGHEDE